MHPTNDRSLEPSSGSFRPIALTLSSDNSNSQTMPGEESRETSIFRKADLSCEISPPTVALANPVQSSQDDDDWHNEIPAYTSPYEEIYNYCAAAPGSTTERVISPYPYSQTPQELQERDHLSRQLGSDWSMREAATFDSDEIDSIDDEPVADFSCFFENMPPLTTTMTTDVSSPMVEHDDDDDEDISLMTSSILVDDEVCPDQVEPISRTIWEDGMVSSAPVAEVLVCAPLPKLQMSPANVSVGSDTDEASS